MKITGVLLICISICTCSCIREYSTLTKFVIENKSSQLIKIKISNFETKFYSTVDTIFSILPNSEFHNQYENDGEDFVYPYPFGIAADSAMILVNDTVFRIFSKDNPSSRNILNITNYPGGKEKKGLYKYIYKFTDEDF